MAEHVFLKVLNMSLTASVVILIVLAVRLVLRRAPKGYSYALWSVVLFRLSCPVTFESVFSLLPVNADPVPTDIGRMASPQIQSGIPPIDRTVNAMLPPAVPEASFNPLQLWIAAGTLLWIAGILLLLGGSAISLFRLRRRLRGAVWEEENVWRVAGLETPFVLGIFHPRIYLPDGLNGGEKRYILLHEQTHIRRKDPLVKLAAFLALCIHWFNPLVWISYSLFVRDMEMSCDERVIRQLGSSVKRDYSGTLLSLSAGQRLFGGTPPAFGEGDTGARIRNILSYKRPAFRAVLAAAAAVAAVCVGLAANPAKGGEQAVTEFVITESPITLHDGTRASVQLVLTEGQILDGEEAGLGGGLVPGENYTGHGELRLTADGAVRSTIPLVQEEQSPGGLLFCRRNFPIRFGDYNQDGNPDFSIGQWGSSSINLFSLFTIRETGSFQRISDPLALSSSEGKGQEEYSVLFTTENRVIQTQFYNNAIGEGEPVSYVWDEALRKFTIQEDPLSAEKAFIAELLSTCRITDGAAELTIPAEIPDSYKLLIQVNGLVPMEDSYMSLHAFEQEETGSLWEAGRAYREQVFEGPPADRSQITFYAGFSDGTGKIEVWDQLPLIVEDGEFREVVSPLDTTVTVSGGQKGKTVFTYTDASGGRFSASMLLPEGWTAVPAQAGEPRLAGMLFAPVNLYEAGQLIGTAGYNDFTYHPEARGENFYVSVYNEIMLGSVVSWDEGYTPVKTAETAETARCRVRYSDGGAEKDPEYHDGILSYNTELQKYIAIELADGAAGETQLAEIAQSVKLSRGPFPD